MNFKRIRVPVFLFAALVFPLKGTRGENLGESKFANGSKNRAVDIRESENGNYDVTLLWGSNLPAPEQRVTDPLHVVRANQAGEILWTSDFPEIAETRNRGVAEFPGRQLVAGQGPFVPRIYALDSSDGSIVGKAIELTAGITRNIQLNALWPSSNGNAIVAGTLLRAKTVGGIEAELNGFVGMVSPDLKSLWPLDKFETDLTQKPVLDAAVAPDGSIYVVGMEINHSRIPDSGTDELGFWSKSLLDLSTFYNASKSNDVIGSHFSPWTKPYAMKISAEGSIQWVASEKENILPRAQGYLSNLVITPSGPVALGKMNGNRWMVKFAHTSDSNLPAHKFANLPANYSKMLGSCADVATEGIALLVADGKNRTFLLRYSASLRPIGKPLPVPIDSGRPAAITSLRGGGFKVTGSPAESPNEDVVVVLAIEGSVEGAKPR